MADTSYLRREVESYVRGVLSARFKQGFEARRLNLSSGGSHEFDAVSSNSSVVAAIKTASGLTASGGIPSGKIKDCVAELYYLSLVDAPTKLLVLTTPAFHEMFARMMVGKLHTGLVIECVSLPIDMQAEVDRIKARASAEVSPFTRDLGQQPSAEVPS